MKRLFASVTFVGALAACTSSTSSGNGGGGGGNAGNANGTSCGDYSACSLVSAASVGQAFGATFSAGTENDVNKTPSSNLAEEVQCNFQGTDGWSAFVLIRCCPCADNDEASVESESQLLGEVTTPVTGVGDTAFWASPGPDAGILSSAYSLNVFKGTDLYIQVNVLTPSGAPAPLSGAKQVAASVLSGI